jgi:hypothetical protein
MPDTTVFSWIPFFEELAARLGAYRDRQPELVQYLRQAGVENGLQDRMSEDGDWTDLQEIDPFTFFAAFNKFYTTNRRARILANLKALMQLTSEVPTDFEGIPTSQPMGFWYFGYAYHRPAGQIQQLWDLYDAVMNDTVTADHLRAIVSLYAVGEAKITQGMFWIRPSRFFPFDRKTKSDLTVSHPDLELREFPGDYLNALKRLRAEAGDDPLFFAQLSRAGHYRTVDGQQAMVISEPKPKGDVFTLRELFPTADDAAPYFDFMRRSLECCTITAPGHPCVVVSFTKHNRNLSLRLMVYNGSLLQINGVGSTVSSVVITASERAEAIKGLQKTYTMKYGGDLPVHQYECTTNILDVMQQLTEAMEEGVSAFGPSYASFRRSPLSSMNRPEIQEAIFDLDRLEALLDVPFDRNAQPSASVQGSPADKYKDCQPFIMNAKPKIWDPEKEGVGYEGTFEILNEQGARRREEAAFDGIRAGDPILIYRTGGHSQIWGLAEAVTSVAEEGGDAFRYLVVDEFETPVTSELLHAHGYTSMTLGRQGSLFTITREQFREVMELAYSSGSATGAQRAPAYRGPLNTILYGPPGTGKTYATRERALTIIDGSAGSLEQQRERYRALTENGQVRFVTFHQSYSYEEFVEGIRPRRDDDTGELSYDVEYGVLRQIASDALESWKLSTAVITRDPLEGIDRLATHFWKFSLGKGYDDADAEFYRYCIDNNLVALNYGDPVDLTPAKTKSALYQLLTHGTPSSNHKAYVSELVFGLKEGDIVLVPDGLRSVRAVGRITGPYRYDESAPGMNVHTRPVEWLIKDTSLPVELFYKGQLTPPTLKRLDPHKIERKPRTQQPTVPDNYVLIIDEINRGNISNILGELITLLEDDKRLSAANEITVSLPYSKEHFTLPPNLYIVGTMNTADRSIALVDLALRRRFTFEELLPDYAMLRDVEGIDLGALLRVINDRLELIYDRDHMIGHAYFMSCKTVADVSHVIVEKLIPLLQEYFFDDMKMIAAVLGDGKKQQAAQIIQFETLSESDLLGMNLPNVADKERMILPRTLTREQIQGIYE